MFKERNISWPIGVGLLAVLVAALAAVLVVIAAPVSAQAASRSATASLSGGAEVPPLTSTAGGSFTGTFSPGPEGAGQLSFSLTSDAIGITQSHIHLGAADENGGVVAFLFGAVDPGVDGIDVSGTITEADLIGAVEGDFMAFAMALEAGNGYVNVHTEANPPGEVRGQITLGPVTGGPGGLPATGSGGLADAGGGAAPVAAAAIAGSLVLLLGLGARVALRRRA